MRQYDAGGGGRIEILDTIGLAMRTRQHDTIGGIAMLDTRGLARYMRQHDANY